MSRFILKTAFTPLSPDQHSVATQSSTLCMSPQILRSSDASAFSTEDLTRQAGICQQLAEHRGRINQRVLLETLVLLNLLESYQPASRPRSSDVKEKPIFELVAE